MKSFILDLAMQGLVPKSDQEPPQMVPPSGGNTWKKYSQAVDWSALELRVLQQAGVDIHAVTAQRIFGDKPPANGEEAKARRQMAKTIAFRELYR